MITITTGHALLAGGGTDGRLPLSFLPQLLQADLREGATGTLADAALSLRILCATPFLVQAIAITFATVALLRILKGVAWARPFSTDVLKNWRLLTLALLGGGVLQGVMDTVANVYLASSIGLICDALDCTPQDLISIEPRDAGR